MALVVAGVAAMGRDGANFECVIKNFACACVLFRHHHRLRCPRSVLECNNLLAPVIFAERALWQWRPSDYHPAKCVAAGGTGRSLAHTKVPINTLMANKSCVSVPLASLPAPPTPRTNAERA